MKQDGYDDAMLLSAKQEYQVCRQCVLPDCDDTDPRCPFDPINHKKRAAIKKSKGRPSNGKSVHIVIGGAAYPSIKQACEACNVNVPFLYSRARSYGLPAKDMLLLLVGENK